jgi:hypothetical protein
MMNEPTNRVDEVMKGKRSASMVVAMLFCLSAAPVAAQPAASGGVDVQVRLDDLVESYAASKTSFAFLLRDVSFGYELSGTGRGALGGQKFSQPRQDIEQTAPPGKEPRGIIIEKGRGDEPRLRVRLSGEKGDVLVDAKFIRSTWSMLSEGRTVTIIAPAEEMGILPAVLGNIRRPISEDVKGHLTGLPPQGIETLELRTSRTEGDQVIIQGNRMGFTVSYPAVTATYSAELKATP